MRAFKVLAILLTYPEQDWIDHVDELEQALAQENPGTARILVPWFAQLRTTDLIALQERYVATFDSTPEYSLHLLEHTLGQARERGGALADMVERYRAHGLEIDANELPDYLPMFLEFVALLPPREARLELARFLPTIQRIKARLEQAANPYAAVFAVLEGIGTRSRGNAGHDWYVALRAGMRNSLATLLKRSGRHELPQ